MDLVELKTFLIRAHHNTFANAAVKKADSLRPASQDYHFEEGDFSYHDTYFGGTHFVGEEVIYYKSKPVWAMNYYGSPVHEGVSESDIDAMLRPALMQQPWDKLPVRGPERFVEEDREYRMNLQSGDLQRFVAEEQILLNGEVIYRCSIHGGLIV